MAIGEARRDRGDGETRPGPGGSRGPVVPVRSGRFRYSPKDYPAVPTAAPRLPAQPQRLPCWRAPARSSRSGRRGRSRPGPCSTGAPCLVDPLWLLPRVGNRPRSFVIRQGYSRCPSYILPPQRPQRGGDGIVPRKFHDPADFFARSAGGHPPLLTGCRPRVSLPAMPAPHGERYDLPVRDLADVATIELMPLEQRIFSWNLNDWIDRGLKRDPAKIALTFIADTDPESRPVHLTYGELQARATLIANLFKALGLQTDDVVLLLLPTLPALYAALLGALKSATPCCVNWMLKPAQLVELARATGARLIVSLGPTPGYEIFGNVQAVCRELPHLRVLTVRGPGGEVIHDCDLERLAARQHADQVTARRAARPDDVAALPPSGGTIGTPKLAQL